MAQAAGIAVDTFPCPDIQQVNNGRIFFRGREIMEDVSVRASSRNHKSAEAEHEAPVKRTLRYRPGELIIKEGDFGMALYRIMSGAVNIFKEHQGKEVLLAELGPGNVLGETIFIYGSQAPHPASAVAKDAVELEAWHCLSLWLEHQTMSPIIQLLAAEMLEKLERIQSVHDSLRIEKHLKQEKAPEPYGADARLTVHAPSSSFKFANGEPGGKQWNGLVEYRLPDQPAPVLLHAAGVAIEEEGILFDVSYDKVNPRAYVSDRVEMMIHLAGGVPVKALGEIIGISHGVLARHTVLQVRFRTMTPEAYQRIQAFLITKSSRREGTWNYRKASPHM